MSIRVLIVDDSSFIREILREVLTRYPDIEVVGEASDGKRAEKLVMELRPDVVTMDLVMPLVGGMEAIRSIMTTCPTPIVVVSDAQSDVHRLAMHAIEAGAIDTFSKPSAGFDEATSDRLPCDDWWPNNRRPDAPVWLVACARIGSGELPAGDGRSARRWRY